MDFAVRFRHALEGNAVELFVDNKVAQAAGGREGNLLVAAPGLERVADGAAKVEGAVRADPVRRVAGVNRDRHDRRALVVPPAGDGKAEGVGKAEGPRRRAALVVQVPGRRPDAAAVGFLRVLGVRYVELALHELLDDVESEVALDRVV